jgi:hypothetical protein
MYYFPLTENPHDGEPAAWLRTGFVVQRGNRKDERIGSASAIPFFNNDQFDLSYSCLRRWKV